MNKTILSTVFLGLIFTSAHATSNGIGGSGLAQIVPPLPGQIVRSLPGQMVQPLPGQIVRALRGQIARPLPGQIVSVQRPR